MSISQLLLSLAEIHRRNPLLHMEIASVQGKDSSCLLSDFTWLAGSFLRSVKNISPELLQRIFHHTDALGGVEHRNLGIHRLSALAEVGDFPVGIHEGQGVLFGIVRLRHISQQNLPCCIKLSRLTVALEHHDAVIAVFLYACP